MGLFDRIKKAFSGNDEETEKKQSEEEVVKETGSQSTDGSSESTDAKLVEDADKLETQPEESDEQADDTVGESVPEVSVTNEEETQGQTDSKETPEKTSLQTTEMPTDKDLTAGDEELNEAKSAVDPEVEPIPTVQDDSESVEPVDNDADEQTDESNDDNLDEAPNGDEEETEQDDVKEYDEGLKKSRNSFSARFNRFLANFRSVDEEFFDDLEELLIESDVGYETAMRISDELREEVKLQNVKKRSDVSDVIVNKLVDMYDEEGKEEDNTLHFSQDNTPTVFLFVGVNGAGKTTTIGKLAHRFQSEGKKVLLAAGDTFRAGAIEQLQRWGERVNVPVEAKAAQTDPASVVYDAVQRAIKEDFDILLVDTAGRLQNNQNLMRELEKIKRVITRELPEAPQEVLLVLDGSTGQNALSQAKQFNETTDVSGIVLTKIDGSSQGGIVLAIRNELHLPVKLVGLGEQMDDLRDFDPEKFIYGLFKELIVGSGE